MRIVIVGPGRVGSAFGRRLVEAGDELVGFIGRDATSTAAAVSFAGHGMPLSTGDHQRGEVVVFCVGDGELESAIAELLAAAPPLGRSLWLHTSGCHGLEVFDAVVSQGARRGALHPASPFADAASGYRQMVGQPAVLLSDENSAGSLEHLASRLGMVAVHSAGGQRTLYHAACALAANGLVVLRGLVDDMFASSEALSPADSKRVADALMTAALNNASQVGATKALSGPIVRGDLATVNAHLEIIGSRVQHAEGAYRALMHSALRLAIARGLSQTDAAALRVAIDASDQGA